MSMIYSLITVYNPKSVEDVNRNIYTIASQVDKIYICDNSASKTLFSELPSNSEHLFFNKNLGLSQAFNKVLKGYTFNNEDFIIFFDQDSLISDGYINSLIDIYKELESNNIKVGCLCPVLFNSTSNSIIEVDKSKQILEGCYEVSQMLTSSTMCRYSVLNKIDFWNEKVFLDLADFDLTWRVKNAGYKNIRTDRLLFNHTYGDSIKKFGKYKITVEAPVREYYQLRESLYLLPKKYVPSKYKKKFLFAVTFRPLLHILLLDNKLKRLKFMLIAWKDFINKKYGEI